MQTNGTVHLRVSFNSHTVDHNFDGIYFNVVTHLQLSEFRNTSSLIHYYNGFQFDANCNAFCSTNSPDELILQVKIIILLMQNSVCDMIGCKSYNDCQMIGCQSSTINILPFLITLTRDLPSSDHIDNASDFFFLLTLPHETNFTLVMSHRK